MATAQLPILLLGNAIFIIKISFPRKVRLNLISKLLIAFIIIDPLAATLSLSRSSIISAVFAVCISSSLLSALGFPYKLKRLKYILFFSVLLGIVTAVFSYGIIIAHADLNSSLVKLQSVTSISSHPVVANSSIR